MKKQRKNVLEEMHTKSALAGLLRLGKQRSLPDGFLGVKVTWLYLLSATLMCGHCR